MMDSLSLKVTLLAVPRERDCLGNRDKMTATHLSSRDSSSSPVSLLASPCLTFTHPAQAFHLYPFVIFLILNVLTHITMSNVHAAVEAAAAAAVKTFTTLASLSLAHILLLSFCFLLHYVLLSSHQLLRLHTLLRLNYHLFSCAQ